MAGFVKKTTGLTGMAVATDPHKTLTILYDKILRILGKMPQDAKYRTHTQLIIQDRLNIVKNEPSIEKVEAKINCGQIEELILQAERELNLARHMAHWKPWEPLIGEAPKGQWKWPV